MARDDVGHALDHESGNPMMNHVHLWHHPHQHDDDVVVYGTNDEMLSDHFVTMMKSGSTTC